MHNKNFWGFFSVVSLIIETFKAFRPTYRKPVYIKVLHIALQIETCLEIWNQFSSTHAENQLEILRNLKGLLGLFV